jgi:hypothetical protein
MRVQEIQEEKMKRWIGLLALPWAVVISSNPYDMDEPTGKNVYIFELTHNNHWTDIKCIAETDPMYLDCIHQMNDIAGAFNQEHLAQEEDRKALQAPEPDISTPTVPNTLEGSTPTEPAAP